MKKAYGIVNIISISDPNKFAEYVNGHIPSIEQYGGRFLVKGAVGEALEGEWESTRMVVHEFPSIEQYKLWYNSEEYKPWKALRQSCSDVKVVLVEGCIDF